MPNPPKYAPQRGNRTSGVVRLPAEGRQKRAPSWPLTTKGTRAEMDAWRQLWRTPQAVQWEKLGWTRTVARYCRIMVAAEQPGAVPALMAQATALEDRLGLTPKSMRLMLWVVEPSEVGAKRAERAGRAAGPRPVQSVPKVKV